MNGNEEFTKECKEMMDSLLDDVQRLEAELSRANALVKMYRELSEKFMLEIDDRRKWHEEIKGGDHGC